MCRYGKKPEASIYKSGKDTKYGSVWKQTINYTRVCAHILHTRVNSHCDSTLLDSILTWTSLLKLSVRRKWCAEEEKEDVALVLYSVEFT